MKSFWDTFDSSLGLGLELEKLFKKARPSRSIPVSMLRIGARDPTLRAGLLQFVDVLPTLKSDEELREHFFMYIAPHRSKLPLPARVGSYVMSAPLINGMAARVTRWAIEKKLAPHFIVGNGEALQEIERLYEKNGTKLVLDFLGEFVVSDTEADYFFNKYLDAMRAKNGIHIAIKFSSLFPYFGPENYDESRLRVGRRFAEILRVARQTNSFVTVDAELYDFRELIEDIFCDVVSRREFHNFSDVGIALQAYLIDSMDSATRLVRVSRERGAPFTVRLVKGAYWDREVALACQRSWPVPVFQEKQITDIHYIKILYFLMQNWGRLYVSPASHNPLTIAFAHDAAQNVWALDDPSFEFQVLYGLGEPVRKVLRSRGLPVRSYVPVGDLTTGMSYFARRILENTANEGFLLELIS